MVKIPNEVCWPILTYRIFPLNNHRIRLIMRRAAKTGTNVVSPVGFGMYCIVRAQSPEPRSQTNWLSPDTAQKGVEWSIHANIYSKIRNWKSASFCRRHSQPFILLNEIVYFWLHSRSGHRFLFRTAAILFHVEVENEWKCSLINVEWALVTKLASWWRQRPSSLHYYIDTYIFQFSPRTHSCNPYHGKWWRFFYGFCLCFLWICCVARAEACDLQRPYKQLSPMPPPDEIRLVRRITT